MDNKARLEAWKKSKSIGRGKEPTDKGGTPGSRKSAPETDVSDLLDSPADDIGSDLTDDQRKAEKIARNRAARKEELRQQDEERRREIESLLPTDGDVTARLDELNRRERRRHTKRLRSLALFGLLPVLLALAYFAFIKENYFQTEASFAIQTVNSSPQSPAASILGIGGGGGGMTDGYRVREYLQSAEVMQIMEKEHGYLSHFHGEPTGNPRLDLDFYRNRIGIQADQQEGILTLTVEAVSAEDAVRYADILLELARAKVRDISRSIDEDQLADLVSVQEDAQDQLNLAQARVQEVQIRQAELDPRVSAEGIYTIINNLEVQLAEADAQRQALLSNGLTESPFLPRLNARVQALENQIAEQQKRLGGSGGDTSLGRSVAAFETAVAERDAAAETLASARSTVQQARLRGLEQRKYLVVIAQPMQPVAREESRLLDILLILAAALVAILIVGLVMLRRPERDSL
ncbi:hypothetical protein [Aurantiacibacter rhizosphaerae]|uniref:Capsule biosynthesis protein n=1 Tax=Aurantiacibacter rhizosphaerae TaxID=2691582 RepID=A0A844XAV1_9SPHN|nr:hypothetical protein [Aurantiacibacter rhizosphaerae]MWV26655.1 hypothetical protein [Aurantiacibacter rhizosphaerae]